MRCFSGLLTAVPQVQARRKQDRCESDGSGTKPTVPAGVVICTSQWLYPLGERPGT